MVVYFLLKLNILVTSSPKLIWVMPTQLPLLWSLNTKLSKTRFFFADASHYRSVVGALQYTTITRPDISYLVTSPKLIWVMPTQLQLLWSLTLNSLKLGLSFADASHYRSVVAALQYATITRPNISYSVNMVCQFMSHPLEPHL